MLRTVLCILALGVNTAVAFQAPRAARSAWSKPALQMSTNDLYTQAPATAQQVRLAYAPTACARPGLVSRLLS